ncbi:LysM peptidoglycan-binding domain-containing protein [Allobranchiibius sp. CTAmp26]|uniref:LysM peptidoglycan-binding domain-containing protein n=1 Tax=Allobranchiibius sp. CTAmp26 TaxID=2815214 RepID=UPI001AA184FE|nr:hypothetical protein [Allobranchiibius sp. CTAmp26]MBO1755580.1 hypothetical protein [Allobranchiibius sp. CTAmp26]
MPRPVDLASGDLHPGRASLLGAATIGALLVATCWSLKSLATAYADLDHRATLSTVDAVPVVVRAALLATLAWATILIVAGLRVVGSTPRELPGGLVGRVALLLLAATMTTTYAGRPASAEAAAATLHSADAGVRAPVPGFGVPVPLRLATSSPCMPAPGWTAEPPARTHHRGATSAPLVTGCAGSAHDGTEVVVRRGDSLWSLVGRQLRTDDPAVIAAEWPRWYAHNRHLIGPDPDLLQVGQILHRPAAPGDPR